MKKMLALLVAAAFWFPFSCASDSAPKVKKGIWRATLKTKGGDLPFGLELVPNADSTTWSVYVLNGKERLKFDTATFQGDSIRIPMSIFESEIRARVSSNTMQGIFQRRRTLQSYTFIPFEARFGERHRFTNTAEPPKTSFTGKWATTFRSESDTTQAVGIFRQQGGTVTGTFLTPTGDYRFLEGNAVGDSLLLSCFDGTHAYLFKAARRPDGTLQGGFWSGVTGYETWQARFDPAAELPDATQLTYLKPGHKTLTFSFPDLSGKPVSLADERFRNKVVVVQLLGSWCPNCMDETNFLSPWYRKNKDRGVEIVGLAYEKSADLKESAPKLQRMIERYSIGYPVLLAGTNNKAEASKTLPMLNRVIGFPTTIVLDRKGNVRQIHTGFTGPGTGNYYDTFVEDFNRLIDKLLAEEL
ncbi:peroxiredoxin family protein [Larkinella soli]|uniref:peroxiredoxin family protein n=1 Tax=Larkinella soli TaxID=1770527 RepID=UPI000FFC07B4|nr:TlpA disulfide reductase family protein [Larkinella soli]